MEWNVQSVRDRVERSAKAIASLARQSEQIVKLGGEIARRSAAGGCVLTCGNGGSAAEAMHLSEELIGRYKADRRPFASVCLNADPTALTCIANDYGFEQIFARQVQGLGRPGDVLVVFSTSGNSPNLVAALRKAGELGILRIGLLGKGGGACLPLCDLALVVESSETEHVQEAHQVLLHLILEAVESTG